MELNKNNMKRIMQLIVFTVLILIGVNRFDVVVSTLKGFLAILNPFIVGGCIAFILNLPMRFIEEKFFANSKKKWLKKVKRPLSLLLSTLFVIGILTFVSVMVIPEVSKTVTTLVETIPDSMKKLQVYLNNWIIDHPELGSAFEGVKIDWDKISATIFNVAKGILSGAATSATSVISGIVSTVTNLIIGFVFSIYVLANKEALLRQSKKLLYSFVKPEIADKIVEVCSLTHRTFSNFTSGQCIEAVILGTMFFITLSILQYPYPLLIGVLIAFTALIPIFGAFIGFFVGAFLILMVNPMQAFWFIIIFNVLQQIEGNLIYPHVVGGSVGLPSLWVLFAVTVGGSLMGVIGMLIFIPIMSVIYTLLRKNVNKRLNHKKIPKSKYMN